MTSREKELLLSWITNEETRLENEIIEARNKIRFRSIDITDCFELALLLQRLSDFRDFALILIRLIHL